jgi:sugar phosphate isomerase/epimerase
MFRIGVNTGFAVNRYPEPEIWTDIVANEFKVDVIQFTVTLLNPFWPRDYVLRKAEEIRKLCDKKDIWIQQTFTDAWTRLNHLTSPDPEERKLWVECFKTMVDMSIIMGAEATGSHFGILSFNDNNDPIRRMAMMQEGFRNWEKIAEYGAEKGLKYVYFEPMSVPREFAGTIEETQYMIDEANENIAIPMKICLDVDHGDLQSNDPRDTDPHAWIRAFAKESPTIHLKQSYKAGMGHVPFTPEHNEKGRIQANDILNTLKEVGCTDCSLILELGHRERWPNDYRVIEDFTTSINYWKDAISIA